MKSNPCTSSDREEAADGGDEYRILSVPDYGLLPNTRQFQGCQKDRIDRNRNLCRAGRYNSCEAQSKFYRQKLHTPEWETSCTTCCFENCPAEVSGEGRNIQRQCSTFD